LGGIKCDRVSLLGTIVLSVAIGFLYRVRIAHEADIDPTFNIGNRWNIDEGLVGDAVDFIEILVESIHQVL